jgi:Protein of unknown function DUF45
VERATVNAPPIEIILEGHTIRVYKQKRNSMSMKTTPVGIVAFIPNHATVKTPQVEAFLREGMKKLAPRAPKIDVEQVTTPKALRALVDVWAEKTGLHPKRITLREMFRKWGSCSQRGSVSLNIALCNLPRAWAEYVILHELVHLRIFNHSKEFKAELDRWMPDWRAIEAEMDAWMAGGSID